MTHPRLVSDLELLQKTIAGPSKKKSFLAQTSTLTQKQQKMYRSM